MSPTAVRDDDASASSRPFFDQMCGPFFLAFRVLGVCPYTRNRNGNYTSNLTPPPPPYLLNVSKIDAIVFSRRFKYFALVYILVKLLFLILYAFGKLIIARFIFILLKVYFFLTCLKTARIRFEI